MAVSVVSFSFSRAAQPEALWPTLLGDGFLYCIFSATSLDPNSSGAPRAPSAWPGFPYHISSITPFPIVWLLSWLSYIIVQRPNDHPLNLWNGMFDRHQAEITVMQFRGHSLPVHHSEMACLVGRRSKYNNISSFFLNTLYAVHTQTLSHFYKTKPNIMISALSPNLLPHKKDINLHFIF